MASSARGEDVAASHSGLNKSEGSKTSRKTSKSSKKYEVLDSWEDQDDLSSEDESETPPSGTKLPAAPITSAPPQPGSAHGWQPDLEPATDASPRGHGAAETRRPEKTDAVARRMIAAGLGLKAPKLTEEQKAYQKSVREQEKKRKEQERDEEQKRRDEAAKAKAAVWDD